MAQEPDRLQDSYFFDAHTHVQFSAYDVDRDAVLARAREAGVVLVNVGTQIDTSRAAVALAEHAGKENDGNTSNNFMAVGGASGVYAAVGLHPVHTTKSFHDAQELGAVDAAKELASQGEAFDIEEYRRLALHKKTVAIGECGLDYFHFSDAESQEEQIRKQKEAFIAQIELSLEVKKPLMIHCRNAFADVIEILNFYKKKFDDLPERASGARSSPGVIHFFTGTPDDARTLLDLGFSFTFGGAITFPPRKNKTAELSALAPTSTTGVYDEVIKLIPLDRILSETDAPYVAPLAYRGKRNEPAYVIATVKKLAELKGIAPEVMKAQIWENAKRIFGI